MLLRNHTDVKNIGTIFKNFFSSAEIKSIRSFGNGHINDTFLLETESEEGEKSYILQRINTDIFKDPYSLMDNIVRVTSFLADKIEKAGGNPDRESLTVIRTDKGENLVEDGGNYWRLYKFIEDAFSYDRVESSEDFYQSAVAFGNFQNLLADFPAESLHETIKDFHNTRKRYEDFKLTVEEDRLKRLADVREEVEFVLERRYLAEFFEKLLAEGKIPLRVTHNDTKLNNVMIDKVSKRGICVVDLDTVMPGLAMNDYGDSIRFGASSADEDERDLDKVYLDLDLFEAYTRGFIEALDGRLTDLEIDLLPMGAKMMTYECGMRFLKDYLEGDIYFKTHREGQNLDRARTQFKLLRDMELKWDKMKEIVDRYR